MKIEVLRLLEESLIGGTGVSTEFTRRLFEEYSTLNRGKTFKDFLKAMVETEEDTTAASSPRVIQKSISFSCGTPEYKNYLEAKNALRLTQDILDTTKLELAKSVDDTLYKISSYEIKQGYDLNEVVFTIPTIEFEEQ